MSHEVLNRLKDSGKGIAGLFSKLIPSPYRQDASVKRSIYKWLLIGLLIRLAFMPFTVYFPDLLGVYWRSSFTAYQGIFSGGLQIFIHYFHAFFLWIFKPLMPYFDSILYEPRMRPEPSWEMLGTFVSHPNVFRTLFLFKVPYLLFDLACAFLLLRIFKDDKKGLAAFIFWMVNPVIIFATYIAARHEVIAIFFILLSLYYARNNLSARSLLSLGVSIIIRFYPLILLPFFIVILGRRFWERVKLAFWGILPLGLLMILTRLFHETTKVEKLARTPQGQYLLSMAFYLGYLSDRVFIFVAIYAVLLLYTIFRTDHSFASLWRMLLILLLGIFATSFFHVHYFMWIVPFLTLQMVEDRRFIGLFGILVLGWIVYSFQWKGVFAGLLFTPINVRYFMSLPSPFEIINEYYSAANFIGIWRSIFSGVCLWMMYLVLRESLAEKEKR